MVFVSGGRHHLESKEAELDQDVACCISANVALSEERKETEEAEESFVVSGP